MSKFTPLSDELHEYIVAHGTRQDDVLRRIQEETAAMGDISVMQIAPDQGALITMLCRVLGAGEAIELGTFTGYSAICIARGLEPGGRLPTTWPATEADVPVLGTTPIEGKLEYSEGVHIGYRAWLRAGRQPAYPFGFGLGYTTWEYQRLEVVGMTARVTLRNTGHRAGKGVVQAYLSRPGGMVERPVRWLAGFAAGLVVQPVTVGPDTLRIRYSCFADLSVPLAAIDRVVPLPRSRGRRRTAMAHGDEPVVEVGKQQHGAPPGEPVPIRLRGGAPREVRRVHLWVDDPQALAAVAEYR